MKRKCSLKVQFKGVLQQEQVKYKLKPRQVGEVFSVMY